MAKNTEHVQHVKSNVVLETGKPKLPLAGNLVEGEIAINYAKDVETISIKNSNGDIVTFSSDNYYSEQKLGSGFTGENSANTVTSVIEENEMVMSRALNDLNENKADIVHTHTVSDITDIGTMASEDTTSYSSATEIATALANKANLSDIADFFDDAKYELSGETHVINFYNGNTVKATIDATEFIKDGFLSGVTVEDRVVSGETQPCLVFEWNTDAGIQETVIPIGGTFDPTNYYNKSEIDEVLGTGFSESSVTEVIEANEETTAAALNDLEENKLDASAYTELWVSGTGENSVVQKGGGNTASGTCSVAEGAGSYAIGSYSHAEGHATATGDTSHAEGSGQALGSYSHAEGHAIASGDTSHAEGTGQAIGSHSHAEGASSNAIGNYSHAEGHAIANGDTSHAEGNSSLANGSYSHAEGLSTIANNQSEHASGQFNISNSATTEFGNSGNTLFSVGNGTADDVRHNAFEIRQNGDIYIVSGGTDILLQDNLGGNIEIVQVIDSGTSASTNAVATKAVVDKLIEDEQVWAISLNELNNKKFGYANFDSTNKTIDFYKDEDDYTSGGTAIDSVDLSNISIDIDQVIDSGTSASTDAVSTSAVYGFVTSYTPSITVDQVLDDTTSASTNPVSSKAVYKAVTDNELVWTNAYVALSGTVSAHTADTSIHVTANDKASWDAKSNSNHTHEASGVTAMTGYQIASSSASVLTTDTLLQTIGKLEKRLALLETALDGVSLLRITQSDYDQLQTKDPNTLYIIID